MGPPSVLHRVIYASRAVGPTGLSTLSIAQILGASERNNRRDGITGCLLFHHGHVFQVLEGERAALDRLIRRLLDDRRHASLRVLVDTPIAERVIDEPICLCGHAAEMLDRVGLPGLANITAAEAEAILDVRHAA